MDAKPQRLRTLRVHDENMPLPAVTVKSLHQRTKSVPAFSTLKREANKSAPPVDDIQAMKKVLGEVNPNAKVKQLSKDDLMVTKKTVETQKDAGIPLVKSAWAEVKDAVPDTTTSALVAPLSRPAVRPSTNKCISAPVVPALSAATIIATKGLAARKSMKVLKDEPLATNVPTQAEPVRAELNTTAQPCDASTNIKQTVTVQHPQPVTDLSLPATHLPAAHQPAATKDQNLPAGISADKEYIIQLEKQAEYFEAQEYQNSGVLPPYAPVGGMTAQHFFPTEAYDLYDDGYTTARSFGLSGDSTGAFTTILVPKPNEKTKLEIEAAKRYVETLRTAEDIDDEMWDTSMVAEYGDEIFAYMRQLEIRMLPDPRYMDIQQEIQWSMRSVLVDWVVQVHARFSLLPETLFLSINYIDRFLSNKVVSLGKLQLVGATALFIAAKFEEVNCPTLQEVIYMVDGGYSMDELLKAERFMLSMLQFDLGWPGPMSFLRRVSKADDYDLETRTLAKYFLEVTVMDERFIGCTPSFLAAGAHCLARLMLRKGEWTVAHVAYSDYTYAQLRPLLQGIMECCDNPRRHHLSVYEKYQDKRYKCASAFVEAELMKGFSLLARLSIRQSLGAPPPPPSAGLLTFT